MRSLFAGDKFRFKSRGEKGEIVREWPSQNIDMTAKVVCAPCNNGWMSSLESVHAKPAMADLILGDKTLTISQTQARGLALFAFKTAVVADHMKRDRSPFYSRSVRHEFARSLRIPSDTQMWLAGFLPMSSGHIHSCYCEAMIDTKNRLSMHVCTYAVGHLVFQVVSGRCTVPLSLTPIVGFEHVAVQFWPTIPNTISWPPQDVLRTKEDFDAFSERWRTISF